MFTKNDGKCRNLRSGEKEFRSFCTLKAAKYTYLYLTLHVLALLASKLSLGKQFPGHAAMCDLQTQNGCVVSKGL